MAKYGIGIGEEFPASEPSPPSIPPAGGSEKPHRRGLWRSAFHITLKIAAVLLAFGAAGWLLHSLAGPFAFHGPYAYHPGWHGHFFFPMFPFLLVFFLIFAFRRHRYGYGCSMRRWHEDMHRERGERL